MENKDLNLIPYSTFLQDRYNFKRSGTKSGKQFNIIDTPSHNYFKLLFYFDNKDAGENSGGLLAPTWLLDVPVDQLYNYNSAWSYLVQNAEIERAEKLEQFVTLLSNINSESPWYFSEISGVDEAINRSVVTSGEFKLEDSRKKISIKCLPDAVDQRIGTLLSLYRDVTWSWIMKREVIPANLRKFDMAVYIWETPTTNINSKLTDKFEVLLDSTLNEGSSMFTSSYKLIEFHNCEIDYNSVKSGLSALNNKEGWSPEYTIDIMFDDCYEHNYNAFMMRTIGDIIQSDYKYISKAQKTDPKKAAELEERLGRLSYMSSEEIDNLKESAPNKNDSINANRLPGYPKSASRPSGIIGNVVNELMGTAKEELKSFANRLFLGNLYTYSISKLSDQLTGALRGQVFNTIKAIDDYAGTSMYNDVNNKYTLSNIANAGQSYLNDVALDRKTGVNKSTQTLGNLYKSNTLINNL